MPFVLATAAGEPPPEPPATFREAIDLVVESLQQMGSSFLQNIPLLVVGIAILILGVVASRAAGQAVTRVATRSGADVTVANLGSRVARAGVMIAFLLIALAVAGISVGAAVAGLGIAGLAVAFALQTILENFIAGILLLIRKPFVVGDQIVTHEHEGTVQDINLRVTKIIDYDGHLILVPNAMVFANPVINYTTLGNRRSRVMIGIDYRDDHDAAPAIIEAAAAAAPGVLASPPVRVVCVGLGDSSVDFEVRYWTKPDITSVVDAQDEVLRSIKGAVEGAGMTIPWPIRTLAADTTPLTVATRSA